MTQSSNLAPWVYRHTVRIAGYKGNTKLVWSGEGKVASEDGARLKTDVAIFTGPLTVVGVRTIGCTYVYIYGCVGLGCGELGCVEGGGSWSPSPIRQHRPLTTLTHTQLSLFPI